MKCYKIKETLVECIAEEAKSLDAQYVVLLTSEEWENTKDSFEMYIDIDLDLGDRVETRAEVNYDSLTGCFSIPDRKNISGQAHSFFFVLDEKGIVIIDDEGYAAGLIHQISQTRRWKLPSLERFLYDFLELIIAQDLNYLGDIDHRLNQIEDNVIREKHSDFPPELNDFRGDLLDLRVHYEQLIDVAQELEENENGFFKQENLRYFRLFRDRVERLQEVVRSLRDYILQIRDLIQTQIDVRQNNIMTHLTIVASIFMPLTLIAGWYGMNFLYMPELSFRYSYLIVILVSIAIVVFFLIYFKKKKWL